MVMFTEHYDLMNLGLIILFLPGSFAVACLMLGTSLENYMANNPIMNGENSSSGNHPCT